MIPSNLSRTPPWPGNKLPVSLILAFLFKKEINKSPIWLINEIISINKIFLKFNSRSRSLMFINKNSEINEILQRDFHIEIDAEEIIKNSIKKEEAIEKFI